MGFLDILIFLGLAVLVLSLVWWATAKEEISRLQNIEPKTGEENDTGGWKGGHVLDHVAWERTGSKVNLSWKFRDGHNASAFQMTLASKETGGGTFGGPLIERNTTGSMDDEIRHGQSRIYKFTVQKKYVGLWGLWPTYEKTITFDEITVAVRVGHVREGTEFMREVIDNENAKAEVVEARYRGMKATEVDAPLLAFKLAKERQAAQKQIARETQHLLGNGEVRSGGGFGERLRRLQRERDGEIRATEQDDELSEESKQEAIEKIRSYYEQQIAEVE